MTASTPARLAALVAGHARVQAERGQLPKAQLKASAATLRQLSETLRVLWRACALPQWERMMFVKQQLRGKENSYEDLVWVLLAEIKLLQRYRQLTQDVEKAFTAAYSECDSAFLAQSLAANDAAALFSGTCAVGCFVDCASNTITCANIGDSRAVVGRFDSEVGSLNQFSVSCIIEMKWLFATSRFKMIE